MPTVPSKSKTFSMRPCRWSSGVRHHVTSADSASAASTAASTVVPSLAASQRRRVMLCVQASRYVPLSSSSSNGAARAMPMTPGMRLSQGSRFMTESKRAVNARIACWQLPALLAAAHAESPSWS